MAENPKKETIDARQMYYIPTIPQNYDDALLCDYENRLRFLFFQEATTMNEKNGGTVRFKYPFSMHCFDISDRPTDEPKPYCVYTIEISNCGMFFCAFVAGGHRNFGFFPEEIKDPKVVLLKFLAQELGQDEVIAALKDNRLKIIPMKNLKK